MVHQAGPQGHNLHDTHSGSEVTSAQYLDGYGDLHTLAMKRSGQEHVDGQPHVRDTPWLSRKVV